MLRSFTAILIIASLLTSNLSRWFVYAGFELNRGYIAEKLCENKAKPLMHCNGKCYLAKKIKQAEEKEKKQEKESQKNQFQEASLTQASKFKFASHVLVISTFAEHTFTLSNRSTAVFQPPKQTV